MEHYEKNAENPKDTEAQSASKIINIGAGITHLKAELESGAEGQSPCYKFQGPHDLHSELEAGVEIRLCNLLFADKAQRGISRFLDWGCSMWRWFLYYNQRK